MSHVLDVNGNIKVTTETNFTPLIVTGDTTLDGSYRNVLVDASGGNLTITLPSVASGSYEFRIKKIDATGFTVTVDASGGELIDDQLTQIISAQYVTLAMINSPAAWWII